jgi:PAS domain-containing protein
LEKEPVRHEVLRESELIDYFQKAPIALHWLSGTGQILWANDFEMKMLGYTPEEYIGHSITEVRTQLLTTTT